MLMYVYYLMFMCAGLFSLFHASVYEFTIDFGELAINIYAVTYSNKMTNPFIKCRTYYHEVNLL